MNRPCTCKSSHLAKIRKVISLVVFVASTLLFTSSLSTLHFMLQKELALQTFILLKTV